MAGLKTFWILIYSLLLLAACVPQTKQTECQGNEAFNAALRTCVPVVGGPSSFINVATYTPAFTQTRHKADTTTLTFSISVSNPYNQTYTVAWERVFNGAPISMCSNALTCSFPASYLGTTLGEVGTHILTAKIVDGTGTVVDTHSFELKINELPKPIINTASIEPLEYALTRTPGDTSVVFKFNIKNNQATITSTHLYRTEWTIVKSGSIIYTETDNFLDFSPAGTNYAYLGNSPTPYFNPSTLGVGSYVVRAVVKNDVPGEVVDEHQWNVTVNHPALKKINNRDIYANPPSPGIDTISTAYNGIAYTNLSAAVPANNTYNFIPQGGFTSKGNYCVSVENGEGTYVGDGLGVKVNFYIDGSAQIYSGTTTAIDPKICLSDATLTTLNTMLFSNTTSTTVQNHTLVARVVDEATSQEYTISNMLPGLGTYPVTWQFSVKPANAAPTISFAPTGTLTGLTSCTDLGNARNCTIPQDTPFTVGINVLDDFYSTSSTVDTDQNKFTYSMTLMRNGTPLSTCTKLITNVADTSAPIPSGTTWSNVDFVGPEYHCGFVVPSYDANGPVNPLSNVYSVVINFSDVGSPIPGTTAATSNTLQYNLNVTEINTAPSVVPQLGTGGVIGTNSVITKNLVTPTTQVIDPNDAGDFVTEGDTMNFHLVINDSERDKHQIEIYKCTDFTSACGTISLLQSVIVPKTNNTLDTLTQIGYVIPQDFLPTSSLVTTPAAPNAFFKVVVTDCPSILNPANATSCNTSPETSVTMTPRLSSSASIFQVKMRNFNPAPQFGGAPNPLTTASLTTMVGYPLTIYPGTVTDASVVSGENTISYQWYIDDNSSTEDSYDPIDGATEQILRWTPSNGLTASTVGIALCVSDGSTVNPQPAASSVHTTLNNTPTGANCLRRWIVNVKKNAVPVAYVDNSGSSVSLDVDSSVAVWQDTTTGVLADKKVIYSAYTDGSNVYVEKTVFDANGNIFNTDSSGFRTVSFPALPTGTVLPNSIKDISLAGTPTHLYIAYQAAEFSNPGAPIIRIRRINKSYGAEGSKTITGAGAYPHPGKFGFKYDTTSLLPVATITPPSTVTISQASLGQSISAVFSGNLTTGNTISTNSVLVTAESPASALDEICSLGFCTDGANAGRYRDFINGSLDRLLQGVSASALGTTTSLFGGLSGAEYIDVSTYVTGKLGELMIFDIGGGTYQWHLPFVDKTTGASLDHIRVLRAPANSANVLDSTFLAGSVSSTVYSSLGAVNYFTNDYNTSNQIIIGSVNTANVATLNVFDLNGFPIPTPSTTTLFNGYSIDSTTLRFSGPVSGNNKYYVMAKVLTTLPNIYEWMVGTCDAGLFCTNNTLTTNGAAYNTATASIFTVGNLNDLSIESYPSSSEARILVNSGTGANTNLYSVRLRSDGDLSCGLCVPLNVSGNGGTTKEILSSTRSVATTKIDIDMTIGTPGSSLHAPTENIRDVMFAVSPVQTGPSPTNKFKPHLGIYNVEAQTINSSSSVSTGETGHRPAFFGDN